MLKVIYALATVWETSLGLNGIALKFGASVPRCNVYYGGGAQPRSAFAGVGGNLYLLIEQL